MKRIAAQCAALLFFASVFSGVASASPITFSFNYNASAAPPPLSNGADQPASSKYGAIKGPLVLQAGANAQGSITFESTLLPNPGGTQFNLPNPAVLALTVTVTGASSGNGTFTLADFSAVYWDTGGATLDFNSQMVGQNTPGSPWGTPGGCGGFQGPANAGDFNLIGDFMDFPTVPVGQDCFTLVTDGGAEDVMGLTSMQLTAAAAPTTPVPSLNAWMLAALAGMLGLAAAGLLRRTREN